MQKGTKDFFSAKRLFGQYFPKYLLGFFVLFYTGITVSVVHGSNSSVVNRIDIRGAVNVNKQIILSRIPIVVGKTFSKEDLDSSLRNVYDMGYFSDVKIKLENSVLVIYLKEKKIINHFFLNGNNNLKDDQLRRIIYSRDSAAYDEDNVNSDVRIIKKAYASIGYLNAVVNVHRHSISPTMLNLTYAIEEGIKTKINSIRFVGNKSYSNVRLERIISLRTSGYLSFGGTDVYSKEQVSFDEESIRNFYYNRGYAAVKVSSRVLFDKEKNSYDLIFDIDEGGIYRFGNVDIRSTLQSFSNNIISPLIKTKFGKFYDPRKIEETTENIAKYLFYKGKSFVHTSSRINRDFAKRIVDIEYIVEQDSPHYIERIEIEGNNQSHDSIIRRELDFSEGDPISPFMIESAKRRIMATGYFSRVDILKLSTSVPDRVVLRVRVEQLSSGSLGLSGNYEVKKGAGIEGYIADNNFFGRGYKSRISLGLGNSQLRNYVFSFENPYFLGSRVSAGFDIKKSSFIENALSIGNRSDSVHITFPVTERISTTFGYDRRVINYSDPIGQISDIEKTLLNHREFRGHSISQGIMYSTLDNRMMPREGVLMASLYDYAGFGGDSKYHRIKYKASSFYTLSDNYDVIGSLKFGYGCIIPINKNLQMFDQLSIDYDDLRGFADRGIGPRVNGFAIGGKVYFSASASVSFPMPFIPTRVGLRSSFFVDSATLYGNHFHQGIGNNRINGNDSFLRFSTGAEISWDSPLGIISVYYGIPLRKQPYDSVMRFGLHLGSRFI
ncbi:outer membrane protein assembly factor BamA [Candidatus Liberibacter brunswickensis]|uniref:outer membrane protein assembly factor BamA n=1 Tax=Candidatus Liberibacter brunswickensis TaxID=1968796 RepID=UPI002FE36B14